MLSNNCLEKLTGLSDAKSCLLAAIIGLVRASVENNVTTRATANLIKKSVIAVADKDDDECEQLIDTVHSEKRVLAPGCADCMSPCGRTADYTRGEFISEPSEIQELKAQLWFKAADEIAENDIDAVFESVCRKLFIFGYETDEDRLREFVHEIDKAK